MSEKTEKLHITMVVDLGAEASKEKLDFATRQLRTELSSQWSNVELIKAEAPIGSRSADAVLLGSLALATIPSAVLQLLKLLHDWCLRAENRTVEIEIKRSKRQTVKLKISGDMSAARLREIVETLEG